MEKKIGKLLQERQGVRKPRSLMQAVLDMKNQNKKEK
jgi:hypothetical protein